MKVLANELFYEKDLSKDQKEKYKRDFERELLDHLQLNKLKSWLNTKGEATPKRRIESNDEATITLTVKDSL